MAPYFHHVALIYNVTGQVIEWYPPQSELTRDGAPAAASYRVFAGTQNNDDTPKIALSTASLDAVSTTVNGASGYSLANRNRILLASTAGITVGRRYLLTSE